MAELVKPSESASDSKMAKAYKTKQVIEAEEAKVAPVAEPTPEPLTAEPAPELLVVEPETPPLAKPTVPEPIELGYVPTTRPILPPFETFKTDGGYDLAAAMKAGWSANDLRIMGFDPGDIGRAKQRGQALAEVEPYKVDGGYDIAAALEAGIKPSTLRGLGFPGVSEARLAIEYEKKLEPYKTEEGYDLAAALKAGVDVPDVRLKFIFGAPTVAEAKKVVATHVQVGPDKEWMAKSDFGKLSAQDKQYVNKHGIETYTKRLEKEQAAWKARHVQVGPVDEWITKADYDKLTEPERGALKEGGVEGLNKWRKETLAGVAKIEVAVAGAKAEVAAKTWEELTEAQQKYAIERGLVAPRLLEKPQYVIQTLTGPMVVSKEVAERYGPKPLVTWEELSPTQQKYAIERGLVAPRLLGLEVTSEKGHTLSRKDFEALAVSQQGAFLEGKYETKTETYGPLGREEERVAIVLPAPREILEGLRGKDYWAAYDWRVTPGAQEIPPAKLEGPEGWQAYRRSMKAAGATERELDAEWLRYISAQRRRLAEAGISVPAGSAWALGRFSPLVKEAQYQTVLELAELVVPGLYLGRHWAELSPSGKALNIAIDTVFIGSFFARPISRLFGKAMTRIKTIYTPAGAKSIELHLKALNKAINMGSVHYIKLAAKDLLDLGKVMKVKKLPGADVLIERARVVIRNAENIARTARVKPKPPIKIVKAIEDRVKIVLADETGGGYVPLRKPLPPPPGKAPVKVLPWTRQEADRLAARGIGEKQLERAFEKAGGNEWRARQLIRQLEQDAKHLAKGIDKALSGAEKRARLHQEPFYKPKRVTLPTPAERVGVAKARAERLAKLKPEVAASDLLGLQERQVAEILTHMPKHRAVVIGRELKILRLRSYAKHLERLGLEPTEALARELAELSGRQRTVALRGLSRKFQEAIRSRLKALGKGKVLPKVTIQVSSDMTSAYLTAAVAANARAFAEALAKADAKTATEVKAKLSPAVKAAIVAASKMMAQGKTATEALAKAETLARAEAKADAFGAVKPAFSTLTKAESLTRVYTALEGATIGRVSAEVIARVAEAVRTEVGEAVKVPRLQLARVKPVVIKARPAKLRPRLWGKPLIGDKVERVRAGLVPITWRQGKNWVTIYPPYKTENVRWSSRPPRGAIKASGKGSAYKSIQALGGDGSVVLSADMGIMDVKIIRPRRKPTKAAIRFKRDPKQRTTSQIDLSLSRVRGK